MAKKHWIQDAVKKPGQLHKDLGVPPGQKIPESKIKSAEAKGGKVAQRAHFADVMKSMHDNHSDGHHTAEVGELLKGAGHMGDTKPHNQNYQYKNPVLGGSLLGGGEKKG